MKLEFICQLLCLCTEHLKAAEWGESNSTFGLFSNVNCCVCVPPAHWLPVSVRCVYVVEKS